MVYRVEITTRAEGDLDTIYSTVTTETRQTGQRWFDSFETAILSLSILPERCVSEPKLSSSHRVVRKLLFGKRRYVYRVYYAVLDDAVRILPVRHAARKEPKRV